MPIAKNETTMGTTAEAFIVGFKVPETPSANCLYGFRYAKFPVRHEIRHTREQNMNSKVLSFCCLALVSVVPSLAQAPQETGEVDMQTNIGAFKITSAGDDKSSGKIKMTFKGSCLVVGYEGTAPVAASTGLRVEYDNKKRDRVVFHGQGTVTLDGKFRAIQWFGQDLKMNWVGRGICRLYGEFDKNQNTGTYTIKGKQPMYWGTGGMQFSIPARSDNFVPPKVHINGGG